MNGAAEEPDEATRLSVVLAIRNGEHELPTQLAALAAQEVPFAWEVIAVDDGSTDRTRQLLDRAAAEGLPVKVKVGPEQGMAAARLAGVTEARGEALLFLDHDDEIEPGYVAAMGSALDDHQLVAARLDCHTLNPGWVGDYRPHQQTEAVSNDFRPFANTGSLGIRRTTFDGLGGFDSSLHGPEDRDLCYRAAFGGIELTLVPGAVLRYRYRSDLRSVYRQSVRGGRGTVELYRRYRDRGMPRRLLRAEARRWLDLAVDLPRHRARVDRARQVHHLGMLVGHLEGCVRSRVWWFAWSSPTSHESRRAEAAS